MGGRLLSLLAGSQSAQQQPALPPVPVVIVGGSFAGLCAARHLERHQASLGLSLTVVEPKDYFEYTPGLLRALVDDQAAPPLLVPMHRTLRTPTTRLLQGWFVGVKDGNKALVRRVGDSVNGGPPVEELPFAFLIVCSGSSYAAPIKPQRGELRLQDRLVSLGTTAKRVTDARAVLVIGGGTVGVELAAEVAVRYPSKPVTLVTRSSVLLPTMPAAAQRAALSWLVSSSGGRVRVLLGDEVLLQPVEGPPQPGQTRTYRTKRGEEVEAALVFNCTGPHPATDEFRGEATETWGWREGQRGLLVRPTLEVPQQQGGVMVLGAGDVVSMEGGGCDWTALSAELQAEAAAQAVIRTLAAATRHHHQQQGPSSSPPAVPALQPYPRCVTGSDSAPLIYAISLGPHHALLVFNSLLLLGGNGWCSLGSRLAATAKWFIEKTKLMEVRQSPPAMWLWERLAHPLTFFLHRLMVLLALVPPPSPRPPRDQERPSTMAAQKESRLKET